MKPSSSLKLRGASTSPSIVNKSAGRIKEAVQRPRALWTDGKIRHEVEARGATDCRPSGVAQRPHTRVVEFVQLIAETHHLMFTRPRRREKHLHGFQLAAPEHPDRFVLRFVLDEQGRRKIRQGNLVAQEKVFGGAAFRPELHQASTAQ